MNGDPAAPEGVTRMARIRTRLAQGLIALAILIAATVSIGGGGSFVALAFTTRPQFCKTCHIMEPYYDSWKESSHSDVTCVDCHFEPGLLETVEGKFQAAAMLAKYVTNTEGTKPWAHVSDYSCMRSGCHSQRLLEGELSFGPIRFDHRHHLIGFQMGTRLRCTSCHSQIVQGNHLSVTVSTCFLCHFTEGPDRTAEGKPLSDCNNCHGPPKEEIHLGRFTFRHADYLNRGVSCDSCHGDVTRGEGAVPRARCYSCHNVQEHVDRYDETQFLHEHHVAGHAVACAQCHTEIEHGLPSRTQHFQGDCTACHEGMHAPTSGVYRGTAVEGVEDDPSVMYLARVTCTGCHRPPFPDAPVPPGGATFQADPLSCVDCHGTGYEGMAERWQAEFEATVKPIRERVEALHGLLTGDTPEARRHYEKAATTLGTALLDGSRGVHNLPYIRSILAKADAEARAGLEAIAPGGRHEPLPIGPRAASAEGCTQLCHVGIETQAVRADTILGKPFAFPHDPHVTQIGLDCADCHRAEPHGTTWVQGETCADCHHSIADEEGCSACHIDAAGMTVRAENVLAGAFDFPHGPHVEMAELECTQCHIAQPDGFAIGNLESCTMCHHAEEDTERCGGCHTAQVELRAQRIPGDDQSSMIDLDCMSCHVGIAEGHTREQMIANCDACHADEGESFAAELLEPWMAEAIDPVEAALKKLEGDESPAAAERRAALEKLKKTGPYHNTAVAQASSIER